MLRNLRIVTESLQPDAGGPGAAVRRQEVLDWLGPLQLANDHLLTPAMHESLAAAGHLGDLPPAVRDYLALLRNANHDRNEVVLAQALEVFAAFAAAGVETMVLKGGLSFFFNYYQTPAARMFQDIDLLVRREDIEKADAVLKSLGYFVTTTYEPVQHAFAEYGRLNSPAAIDIHVELIDAYWVLPSDIVWGRAERVEYRGGSFFIPSATDRLLHNFLHAQVHHVGGYYGGTFDLRQLYEFSRILDRDADSIDWDEVFAVVGKHYLERPLLLHAWAAHRLFAAQWELPVPISRRTQRQYWRCLLQVAFPSLERANRPLANVRSAFAKHRMVALYGEGSLFWQQVRHTAQFLRKTGTREWIRRLARTH